VNRFALALFLGLAACPKGGDKPKPIEPIARGDAQPQPGRLLPDETRPVALPPAPALPAVPASLPPLADNPRVTADAVAFGELLFHDPRLSVDGTRACATCHVPARGFAGDIDVAADGKPNLRRAPALVNLAWATAFGWDGRSTSLTDQLLAHLKGQLDAIDPIAARIAAVPTYAAHAARVGGTVQEAIVHGLEAYVLTRYEGDAPWDTQERTALARPGNAADPIVAGYQLFRGKAQCAVCHTPPLYTDGAYHRVVKEVSGDKGRGLVDPAQVGAFKTPTLRGAMLRGSYFHNGSKKTLDEVIAYYTSIAADKTLDPALAASKALSPDEARRLSAFVNMLSANRPAPAKPLLP
jgi:cytochrome c peroxidase